ncbi:MAG: C1 family peptidase [Dehalococcoidia bacterium]
MVRLVALAAVLALGLVAFVWALGISSSTKSPDGALVSTDAGSGCPGDAPGMADPAAVHCRELGYQYRIVDTGKGQYGVCVFPNGTRCDAWRFLQGKCGQRYSYCTRQGYGLITKSDGRNAFSREYSVCVHAGREIGAVTDLMKLGEKATKGSFPAQQSTAPLEEGASLQSLPPSFDWRDYNGQDWMTSVKNQGWCGSCWAFSAVGVVEAIHNIAWNDPHLDLDLSEQYLVSDCLLHNTCCGGWHQTALDFVRTQGIPDEGCLPYVDGGWDGCTCGGGACDSICTYGGTGICSDTTCSDRCADWQSRLRNIIAVDGVSASQIKQHVVNKGPLAVAMRMGSPGFGEDGIYRCEPDFPINHAVIIAGYDDAGGYWIVKNSWGTSFGEAGYFKVGYGECYIENYVYYADPPPPNQYRLTMRVWPPESGTTSPAVGEHWYDSGSTVPVSASGDSVWRFDGWSGDCSGTDPSTSVYMDANKICTARFSRPGCLFYNSSDVPQPILDKQITLSTLDVGDSFTLTDVNAGPLTITHTYDADLDVFLISPQGTRVELFTEVGGNGHNFVDTFLDDECATPITDGTAPFTGCYRPEGSLAALDGESSAGTWTLEIEDRWKWDTGTLDAWSVELCGDVDRDGDGFLDLDEVYIGTDPYDACTDEPDDLDACPFDINMDTWVNILDVLLYKPKLWYCDPDPGYDRRYDVNVDGCIDILDVLLYKPVFMTSCASA